MKISLIHIPLLCCLLAICAAGSSVHADDGDLSPEAIEAVMASDWNRVIGLLKEETALGEQASEVALYWYGVALFSLGDQKESLRYLTIALKKNPHSLATAQYLARAAVWLKDVSERLAPAELALEAFPNDPDILAVIGRIHYERMKLIMKNRGGKYLDTAQKESDPMFDALRKALRIDPLNQQAHEWLGRGYYQDFLWYERRMGISEHDLLESAIKHLLIAQRFAQPGFESSLILGHCYSELGQYVHAAEAYKNSLQFEPDTRPEIWIDYGKSLLQAGRSEEALNVLRGVYRQDHSNHDVRFWFGRAAFEAGDYASALFGFREAYTLDPAYRKRSLFWSAQTAFKMEQYALTLKLLEQITEPEQETISKHAYLHLRGKAKLKLGKASEAADDLHSALRVEPANREYAQWALAAYKELDDPFNMVKVAATYGRDGRETEALEVMEWTRQIKWVFATKDSRGKNHPQGFGPYLAYQMGNLYMSLGDYRVASVYYRLSGVTGGYLPGWAAVLTGDSALAKKRFERLSHQKSGKAKSLAALSLAYLSLLEHDTAAAREHIETMKGDNLHEEMGTTVRRWADVLDGKENAASGLDAFDLLGVYTDGFIKDRGMKIRALIPGGALSSTSPAIVPGDLITAVDNRDMYNRFGIGNVRKYSTGNGELSVLVKRGKATFEIRVDPAAARARAAQESDNRGRDQ